MCSPDIAINSRIVFTAVWYFYEYSVKIVKNRLKSSFFGLMTKSSKLYFVSINEQNATFKSSQSSSFISYEAESSTFVPAILIQPFTFWLI